MSISCRCGCRNAPEDEAKLAILEAFNRLSEHRDELTRQQAELQSDELKRIEALLDKSREAEQTMEARCIEDVGG